MKISPNLGVLDWVLLGTFLAISLGIFAFATFSARHSVSVAVPPKAEVRYLGDNTYEIKYEGHIYLAVFQGGLVHAAHCPCKR